MLAVSPLLLLLVMMVSLATAEDGYCALSPRHTLCRYTGLGRACGGRALGRGVTRAEVGGALQLVMVVMMVLQVETILDTHNQLRARLARGEEARGSPGPQPPAADMRKMVN